MRKILYTRPDGGLSVVHPVRNSLTTKVTALGTTHLVPETLTDAQIEQRAWDRLPPDAINPRYADPTEIPPDRYFRNAWKDGNTTIAVDMPKAVVIQQDKLRELRAPLLGALDTEYMKALEVDDKAAQAAVIAKKQALRDVTDDPNLAKATTPDQLKAAGLDVIAANADVIAVDADPVKG